MAHSLRFICIAATAGALLPKVFAWTSSNPAVASITPAGQMVGVAVGGPVTITATVEGKSGTASLSVANDIRFGCALADQPLAAGPYTPDANYRFNPSGGGSITQRNVATGSYQIIFGGLGNSAGATETVIGSKFGSPNPRCSPSGWVNSGVNDLTVNVTCWGLSGGAQVDTKFIVLVIQ